MKLWEINEKGKKTDQKIGRQQIGIYVYTNCSFVLSLPQLRKKFFLKMSRFEPVV